MKNPIATRKNKTHLKGQVVVQVQMTTQSILRKWNERGMPFIRWKNGNVLDCRRENLEAVSFEDFLKHFDDWVIDWDMDLEKHEIALVQNPEWRKGLFQRPK